MYDYGQVADQSGKALNLPLSEKKALTVALALHEKGRAFLKSQHFSKSLVFLLESDTVYKYDYLYAYILLFYLMRILICCLCSQCHSSLLDMVDNYGLLNLDIAWCYLSLRKNAKKL